MKQNEFYQKYKEIITLPPKEAIKEFKKILKEEKEPNEINLYCVVGIMYFMLETTNNQKIMQFMKKPLSNLNKYPDCKQKCSFLLLVGLIYTEEEQHDLARFYYSMAVKLSYRLKEYPLYASTLNNISISYANEEKYQLALDIITEGEKYIAYLPDDAKVRVKLNKVICLFKLEQHDLAFELYKELKTDENIKIDLVYPTYLYIGIELYHYFNMKDELDYCYSEVENNIDEFPVTEALNIGVFLIDYAFEKQDMHFVDKLKEKLEDYIKKNPENYKIQLQYQKARTKYAQYTNNKELERQCLLEQLECYEQILKQNSKYYLKQAEQTQVIEKLRMKYETEKTENERLKVLSYQDSLTGVRNKRALLKALEEKTNNPVALGILDIDRFKHINDAYSHSEGDQVLKRLGQIMQSIEHSNPVDFYRFGGDEFVFIIKKASEKEVVELIEYFHRLAKLISFGDDEYLSTTVGYIYRDTNINLKEMFEQADQLLYQGKDVVDSGKIIHN